MTYEPYLSAVRAKPEAGKIIATTLDYPMVMDTFGCTPKFLAENPKAAKALADAYFDAVDMIKADPKKSFEIMGADVKQSGEAFEKSQAYLRWQDRAANQKFFAGEHAAFSKEAADLLLEAGIIKHDARHDEARRHAIHQVSASAPARGAAGGAGRRMKPLVPVAPGARLALGIAFFVVFVAVWSLATFGGFVSKTFLADPVTMVRSGWTLLATQGFGWDIGWTVWRVFGGFVIAAVLALPLGVAMGAYKPIEAFFEPFVSFARYLPASAFIPLLILWAGIGEAQKLALIFIGSFFQLVLMIAVIVGNTRRDLVEAAYTLGVGDRGLIRRVLLPGAAPEIAEVLRMVLGWAWTYVIVAELIGASSGIGHMITDSQALLATDQIIFGIIVIGVIGLVERRALQGAQPAPVPVGGARPMSALGDRAGGGDGREHPRHPQREPNVPLHARATTLALQLDRPRRRRERLRHHPRPLGLRQEHAAAHRRRPRPADRRRGAARRPAHRRRRAPTAAWCSRATRSSRG